MTKQQALNQLRLMQAWHEDNGDGPNADYDAICFAMEAIERSEDLEKQITALETEHAKLREMQKVQPETIHCNECQHSEYDALYGDRWCHYDGKAEVVKDDHYCGYAERRTDERSD